ncbi:hypothetical protein TNIN_47941 [Trichonephila inaurata madagascariensis]|uniref:Uncharacterized protein n=1 Tax=Trichonephila inaurata madagascariensis TaxID=2747483 RepID=A0A8X6IX47_9ARAC|nr:hypothetical protein TNIN_47941 [Trichonephila inaurata madagascariensis]
MIAISSSVSESKQAVCTSSKLSVINTLIRGLLKKPSPTPSLAKDENDEPPPKRRVTTCIPHQAAHNNEARHMPEMVEGRNHRSKGA